MSDGRDDRGADVTNRLSQRFGDAPDEEQAEQNKNTKSEQNSQSSKSEKNSMSKTTAKSSKSTQKQNIKDRPSVLMYLPQELHTELDLRFDELNLQYKREHGEALGKNRDFYPAVIEASLEGKEIKEVLEERR
jgi:hypothetical protein